MNSKHEVVIEPRGRWYEVGLTSLWSDRELLRFLISRDIRVRYRQTAIGVSWALLQPALMALIFTVVFSSSMPPEKLNVPYPLFALSGLTLFFFISSSVTRAAWSLVTNRNLVTKIYVPRLLIVVSSVLAGVVEFALSFILLCVLMFAYSVPPTSSLLLAPYFLLMAMMLSLALGIFFAAVNMWFRDVEYVLPFAMQLWMFCSGVFYPMSMLSSRWQTISMFNPLAGLVEGFRSAMFGLPLDVERLIISFAITVVLFIGSLILFGKLEPKFADII